MTKPIQAHLTAAQRVYLENCTIQRDLLADWSIEEIRETQASLRELGLWGQPQAAPWQRGITDEGLRILGTPRAHTILADRADSTTA